MGSVHSTGCEKSDFEMEKWLKSPNDRFFINFRSPNLCQIVDAPEEISQRFFACVASSTRSVKEIWRPRAFEIEFLGGPFSDCSNKGDEMIEVAFCEFLVALQNQNWFPAAVLNLSPFCDRSTCYFQKRPSSVEKALDSVCVSINFSSPFTISLASSEDACLDFVVGHVKSALITTLRIFDFDPIDCVLLGSSDRSRLLRTPCNLWKCVSEPHSILNRRFFLEIVRRLENVGHRLLTCVDFRGNSDSVFFIKTSDEVNHSPSKDYFLLSAHHCDLLRLIEAPKDVVDVTRLLLSQHWSQGIDSENSEGIWHEFRSFGLPWAARGVDAVESHAMVASLLQTYLARGWKPIASVQLSRTFKDRSCVVLKKERPAYRPHICLGLLESNELHLINAGECLRDFVLDSIFPKTLAKHKTSKCGWPFFLLPGEPWCNMSLANNGNINDQKQIAYDFLEARAFLQKLLAILQLKGWDVVMRVDLAARMRYRRKSSTGQRSSGRRSLSPGKSFDEKPIDIQSNIPLEVNSLILANLNGSRHNSFAKSKNEISFL